jgi:hypothetical protein
MTTTKRKNVMLMVSAFFAAIGAFMFLLLALPEHGVQGHPSEGWFMLGMLASFIIAVIFLGMSKVVNNPE